VVDNTEATIFVGQSVPYAEIRTVATQSGGSTTEIAEGRRSPVKVGFQLMIIPRIIGDKILVTVIPENSVLIGKDKDNPGFERFKISGQEIVLPRTSDTTLITRLMVEDSKTIILGGLQTENITIEERAIPILKDIPILGYFFRKKDEVISKEHLLIVITPRIVKSTEKISETIQQQLKTREKEAEKYLDDLKKHRKENDPMNQMRRHLEEKEKEFEALKNGTE
jgi:general secretion pathway protein D